MSRKPIYDHVRNVDTGELFERTPDALWAVKLNVWKEAMRQCGYDVRKCPVPSPMPYGHIMFRGTSPTYRPVLAVPTLESVAFENAFDGSRIVEQWDKRVRGF